MISQQHLQKQQLKISPQQIQLLNFYALNMLELEQRINVELEENPFLEMQSAESTPEEQNSADDVQDYQDYDEFIYDDKGSTASEYKNYIGNEHLPEKPLAYFSDFKENAKLQINCLDISQEKKEIAEYLIDALNEKGILERSVEDLAEDISFQKQIFIEPEEIRKTLHLVQQLEPIGLGVSSIQECLLIQLQNIPDDSKLTQQARTLVEIHYDSLINRRFDKICHSLGITSAELNDVLQLIGKLKFYPVREHVSSAEPNQSILPDFIISRYDDKIVVSLYSSKSDSVCVNQSLYDQMKETNKKHKSAKQYIHNKIQSAQWFVDAVKQRENTMLKIMRAIVDFQYEYFLEGDIELLKPMILKDISEITGNDLSTISRITANRYAETHFGLIFLKDLFSEKIHAQKGEVVSNKVVQARIKDIVSNEDKKNPYTDQQIADILVKEGYTIARRTISKYREMLKIPIAHVRSFQFDLKV